MMSTKIFGFCLILALTFGCKGANGLNSESEANATKYKVKFVLTTTLLDTSFQAYFNVFHIPENKDLQRPFIDDYFTFQGESKETEYEGPAGDLTYIYRMELAPGHNSYHISVLQGKVIQVNLFVDGKLVQVSTDTFTDQFDQLNLIDEYVIKDN